MAALLPVSTLLAAITLKPVWPPLAWALRDLLLSVRELLVSGGPLVFLALGVFVGKKVTGSGG